MEAKGPKAESWVHYPHDADIGVRGFGRDAPEAFANAARAMTEAITSLKKIRRSESVEIECASPDLEMLFYDWMNAVIFEMSTRGMLFFDFAVRIDGGNLNATATGEPIDVRRHAPAVEPKGATLTGLRVGQGPDGRWSAECIVDV